MERYLTANLFYWKSILGLNHLKLAKVMGISASTLYLRLKNPGDLTVRELMRLANAAGVSLGEIVDPSIHDGKNCAEGEDPEANCRTCTEELPLGGCGRMGVKDERIWKVTKDDDF